MNKATKTLILSSNNTQFGSCQPRLLNDLDVDGDAIYFVDTSYLRSAAEALQEIGEAQPRGRLFKFTQSTSKVELLLDNLYFPNGITLTPQKDALLISEMTKTRITRYFL